MLLETVVAALVGMAGLWLVLEPVLGPGRRTPPGFEPLDPEETPRGVALTALKDIDFDRETGKLSDDDYEFLKAKYTAIALQALRGEEVVAQPGQPKPGAAAVGCTSCGPRPEPDAIFCSSCGLHLIPGPTDSPASAGVICSAPPAGIPTKPLQAG